MIDWQGLRATAGVSILLQAGRELGMTERQCLQDTSLELAELEEPLASIASWQEMALIRNIQEFRQSDEELGLQIGQGYDITKIGPLGQAMAACDNLIQALELTERYRWFGLSFSDYRFEITADSWVIEVLDEEVPRDCRRFCEERGLAASLTLFTHLLQRSPPVTSVSMIASPPKNPKYFEDFFGAPVTFSAEANRIVYDRMVESLPLPQANPQLRKLCESYCDQMLEQQRKKRSVLGRVESLLEIDMDLSSADIAQQLEISERQLRRKLAAEGCSFRELVLVEKMGRAQQKLNCGLSVEQVAKELGYSDSASFSRAFKSHLGINPKRFQMQNYFGD